MAEPDVHLHINRERLPRRDHKLTSTRFRRAINQSPHAHTLCILLWLLQPELAEPRKLLRRSQANIDRQRPRGRTITKRCYATAEIARALEHQELIHLSIGN